MKNSKIILLMEAAKAALETSSDRELARAVGVAHTAAVRWRKGEWPSDDNLVKLCEIAGQDAQAWLLELNIERAGPKAGAVYQAMLNGARRVAVIAATVTIMAPALLPDQANASGTNKPQMDPYALYYGKYQTRC